MPLTRRQVQGTTARGLVERTKNDQLTYAPVGMSLGLRPTPAGFHTARAERVIGTGAEAFAKVGYALMHWELNAGAGFHVQAQHPQVRVGERVGVVMPLLGLFGVAGVCEVVEVVAEGDVIGFAYGSLPRHPVQGEESFVLTHQPDDTVSLAITSVSRPAAWFARLAGPIGRAKQKRAMQKYLDAAQRAASAPAPAHAEP